MDQEIIDTALDLIAKTERQVALHKELYRSIQIRSMCKDAFSHGGCSVKFTSGTDGDVVFRVTRGDGSTRFIPWDDVPACFKDDEADRRGITHRSIVLGGLHNPGLNGPVGKRVRKWVMEQRNKEVSDV